jgi:hypothetical protein
VPSLDAPTSTGDVERSGLGDVRLTGAVQLGRESKLGSWWGRAGAKAPTADADQGLGTGAWDVWAGFGWLRQGWALDVDAYLRWVRLGDPAGVELTDGMEAGVFCEWPGARLALGGGIEASEGRVLEDPVRVTASGYIRGSAGARSGWEVEVAAGLSESAPRFGITGAWRF